MSNIQVYIKRQPITNQPLWCKMDGNTILTEELLAAEIVYSMVGDDSFQIITCKDRDIQRGAVYPLSILDEFLID